MFDINNEKLIMELIDLKKLNTGNIVVPIYIKIGNDCYGLNEINDISFCTPSMLRIIVGSFKNVFSPYGFPDTDLMKFSNVRKYNVFDDESQVYTDYVTFETSYIDEPSNPLEENINKWYEMICDKVMDNVESIRKSKMKEYIEELEES